VCFAFYDPSSRSWKTPQRQLFEDGYASLEISPSSGSMRNGCVFEAPTSAGLSVASASSCWPAPVKSDAKSSGRHTTSTGVMHHGTSLTDAVRAVLRQDPTISAHCEPGQPSTVVLNPDFVEILLSFPRGWTASEPSETPPCPCLSPTRGASSARDC
jgi:hypothetical protein